jgi:RHS repeat-associated protein
VTKSQRITDSAGNINYTVDLDPWGSETGRTSGNAAFQPHRFTSYERDANAGDDAMFRRYQSAWTRFSQPDPYEGSYDLTDPQSFNRYAYVQNDPVNFVDPSGLDPGDAVVRIYTRDRRVDHLVSGGRSGGVHRRAPYVVEPRDRNNRNTDVATPQDPKGKEVTDCDVLAALVDQIALRHRDNAPNFSGALRDRLAPSETVAGTEFTSTGFKPEFRDDVGPGNTPNQVRHYVGGFRAVYIGGYAGAAYANLRERGGTASNQADLRLNAVSRAHAFAIISGEASIHDLAEMIRRDVCDQKK